MPTESKKTADKTRTPKLSDAEQVAEFMEKLDHPLKAEIEAVRHIIKNSSPLISERIKWNAPSYYTSADLLTFNPKTTKNVQIVFHHIAIVDIKSDLLEGNYKDRRLVHLLDMAEVMAKKAELERIIQEYVSLVN
jgi:uncharacterized protein YdhG (YjbR/CyaY superfamily)